MTLPSLPSRIELDFKRGMRRLASTITILTTAEGDAWYGMTATSVCSVCAQPPSLLACIARSASLHAPTASARRFCVNLLRIHHGELVSTFSGKLVGAARFATADWRIDERGLPFLADAQAVFFCTVETSLDYGDHEIFVARVDDVHVEEEISPLLYQDGRLASSKPIGE